MVEHHCEGGGGRSWRTHGPSGNMYIEIKNFDNASQQCTISPNHTTKQWAISNICPSKHRMSAYTGDTTHTLYPRFAPRHSPLNPQHNFCLILILDGVYILAFLMTFHKQQEERFFCPPQSNTRPPAQPIKNATFRFSSFDATMLAFGQLYQFCINAIVRTVQTWRVNRETLTA